MEEETTTTEEQVNESPSSEAVSDAAQQQTTAPDGDTSEQAVKTEESAASTDDEPRIPYSRLSKEVRRRHEAERRIKELESQITKPAQSEQREERQDAGKPNPDEYEDGKYDEKYISDLHEWNFSRLEKQREQQRRQAEERQTVQRVADTVADRMYKNIDLYPDFESVALDVPTIDLHLFAETKNTAELCYRIGKDPVLVDELKNLSPAARARRVYEMDFQISNETKPPPRRTQTNAPPPATEIGNSDATPRSYDNMSIDEIIAYDNKRAVERMNGGGL